MPEFKLNPPRPATRKKQAAKKTPRPDSYPRIRKAGPRDVLTFTDGAPRKRSEAQVLAACRMLMKERPGYRMERIELIRSLKGTLDGVKDYHGYVCWLAQKGFLVTVGGRA